MTASRISCTLAQNGDSNPVGLSRTARTRESTFAFRRLSTMERTVGVLDPRRYPTTSAGASSVSDPPTRSTSVAFDGTAGSRPNRRYSAAKPTMEMKNAKPSSVNRMPNPRRAIGDHLALTAKGAGAEDVFLRDLRGLV